MQIVLATKSLIKYAVSDDCIVYDIKQGCSCLNSRGESATIGTLFLSIYEDGFNKPVSISLFLKIEDTIKSNQMW